MDKSLVVAILVTLMTLVYADVVKYHGHSVLRATPQSDDQMRMVQELLLESPMDVWQEPRRAGTPFDIRVSPNERQTWMDTLSQLGMEVTVMIPDIQALADQQTAKPPLAKPVNARDLDQTRYYDLSEIWEFMDEKVEQCGDLCEVISIGLSYEGRDLKVLKIGSPNEGSPSLWIDTGIHAREWISPAVGQYIMERLVADYGSDDVVNQLREGFNWYINPVVNPDGYDFTWTDDRMWRKTKSDYGEGCIGTDGNRNFDWSWSGPGSSGNPCGETYHGPSSMSEVEIQAINDFVSPFRDEFRLVLTFHSYAQEMYYPWGDGNLTDIPDFDDVRSLCEETMTAMRQVHGERYTCWPGSGPEPYGGYSGNTPDWGYGSMGIKYAYLIELRDLGEYAFILPPEQIVPQNEEVWAGLTTLTLRILAEEEAEK